MGKLIFKDCIIWVKITIIVECGVKCLGSLDDIIRNSYLCNR